ncbi:permease-like cell division protein FtsX [bacterium]|nr:permease-like cell division protein FtsX [bacterium]
MRWFIDLKREMREAWVAFRRNGINSFGSIIISMVALFSLAIILLLSVYVQYGTKSIGQRLNITAFFDPSTAEQQLNETFSRVKELKTVSKVEFISPEQALEELKSRFPDLNEMELEESPIPPSIRIVPANSKDVSALIRDIREMPGIASVTDVTEAAKSYFSIVNIGTLLGLALIFIFFAGFIFAVSASTSLSIYAYRKEIEIMQFIGATRTYVRAPFLILGSLYGFLGALLASLSLYPVYQQINQFYYSFVSFDPIPIQGLSILIIIMILTIVLGILIGSISAYFAVRRYFK